MEFIKYEKLEDFVNENFELILEKEWLNCLMVGNCLEGLKTGANYSLLAKVTENENTQLIMLYRKPWKLLLYSPTNNTSDELYKFAAEEVCKQDSSLSGVNAENEIANKFAKYYCEALNMKYKLAKPMKILLLEKMVPTKLLDDLTFRKANINDKEILVKYIKDFQEEALGEEMSYEKAEQKFEAYLEKGYYVLEKQGKIVSQAILARDLKKGKCVSGVYTPKEERGKGFAYNLVYMLSKKCLDEGAEYCVLYTDAGNPISNHVYEKIGYEKKVECEDLNFII